MKMQLHFLTLPLLLSLLAIRVSAQNEAHLDEAKRLVQGIPTEWINGKYNQAAINSWLTKLRNTPDLTEAILTLAFRAYDGRDDGVEPGAAFFALKQRIDVTPGQVERVTNVMRQLISTTKRNPTQNDFLYGGIQILENFPSDENEDLSLTLIKDEDALLKINAVTTLAKIGGEKSLKVINDMVKMHKPEDDSPDDWFEILLNAQSQITKRLQGDASSRGTLENPTLPSDHANDKHDLPKFGDETALPAWLIWLVGIVAAVVVVVIFLRKSSK